MTTLTDPLQVPDGKHYAAIVFKKHTVHHEGDQRSRDCPGHGYPAYSETIHAVEYIHFTDREDMISWIKAEKIKPQYERHPFKVVEVSPLKITTSVHVETEAL